jgi:hypothetical protein
MYVCWKCGHEHADDLVLFCSKCSAVNPATSRVNQTLSVKPKGFTDRLNARLHGAGLLQNDDIFTLEIGDNQIHVSFSQRLVIGRDFSHDEGMQVVDLAFYNAHRAGVSRRHAALQRSEDGTLHLVDLGSTNGTFVNDVQLEPGIGHPLSDGDEVKIGSLSIVIRFDTGNTDE